jgi:hypothetical protein
LKVSSSNSLRLHARQRRIAETGAMNQVQSASLSRWFDPSQSELSLFRRIASERIYSRGFARLKIVLDAAAPKAEGPDRKSVLCDGALDRYIGDARAAD